MIRNLLCCSKISLVFCGHCHVTARLKYMRIERKGKLRTYDPAFCAVFGQIFYFPTSALYFISSGKFRFYNAN